MSIHDGHRKRIKDRYLTHGLDSFQDHEVLELLLYYAIPRGDVNPIAHDLIRIFGSLDKVFDASVDELRKVPGVGDNAAVFLSLIPSVMRRYEISRSDPRQVINTSEKAGKFLLPYFLGAKNELVYLLCLDSKCRILNTTLIDSGSLTYASISIRKIVETALGCNAAAVIISHNHPGGTALPSGDDIETTSKIKSALQAVEVQLADHIIVADGEYVSLADNDNL